MTCSECHSHLGVIVRRQPESPAWANVLAASTENKCMSKRGFLAKWAYFAATDPRAALAHLLYLGYQVRGMQRRGGGCRARRALQQGSRRGWGERLCGSSESKNVRQNMVCFISVCGWHLVALQSK